MVVALRNPSKYKGLFGAKWIPFSVLMMYAKWDPFLGDREISSRIVAAHASCRYAWHCVLLRNTAMTSSMLPKYTVSDKVRDLNLHLCPNS